MKLNLNSDWKMQKSGDRISYLCNVPCSVYKTLVECGVIENPYYRENELWATNISNDDFEFKKTFEISNGLFEKEKITLTFYGIDTLCEIFLNGKSLGTTNNMHRTWVFDIKDTVVLGTNRLRVLTKSPNKFIAQKQAERPLWGVDSTMAGYTHLRKPHYMFGWDWGPKLPDMGIWRDVEVEGYSQGKILDVYYWQEHIDNCVTLNCDVNTDVLIKTGANYIFEIYSPDNTLLKSISSPITENSFTISTNIENPMLWWARGYGDQPLYKCILRLNDNEIVIDTAINKIGLRTLTISQDSDEWGKEFCFKLNGRKIFAMGANYIPEDQIASTFSKERTLKLLDECVKANFNFIRVWGGGCYPDNWFYDYCDEKGLIIWQDFMYACSAYLLTDEFRETIVGETIDNIKRFRNHASLGLWCGNNEIESAWEYWGLPEDPESKADYLEHFEKIIPELLEEYDKHENTFYWPSSPSSGGGFKDSSSNHAGDMLYWDIWHNLKPIEDFRKYYYRFCSEYGFESVPCLKTCKTFADESKGDFNLTSPVMENHQKCVQGNEKIMFYLAQVVRYPYSFEELIYSSQLVQADCIRTSVEHMRRNRGRCMGSAYWQVNDSNPVISWSSIDYYNRWKALHYYAKRFYAPALLSVDDTNILKPVFNISNETLKDANCRVSWTLRTNGNDIITSGSFDVEIFKLSSKNAFTTDLSKYLLSENEKRERYLEYTLEVDNNIVSKATTLFVRPKLFSFLEPNLKYTVEETDNQFIISISAKNYTKSLCLDLTEMDCVFSDNWFDINGGETVNVTVEKSQITKETCSLSTVGISPVPKYISLDTFKEQLTLRAYN
ncbi:MAG: glycoside hydrolase family 2 protein [Clostridiales bacterium]|nr:glycoside hydrolase family 2 protein [Clostridiales bacterium]